jgi:hypothetical protein
LFEEEKLTEFWIPSDETVEELACFHQIQLGLSIRIATDLE